MGYEYLLLLFYAKVSRSLRNRKIKKSNVKWHKKA